MSSDRLTLLEALTSERRSFDDLVSQLSPDDMLVAGAVGAWSVKDLLAHIADWEERFVVWFNAQLRGDTSVAEGMTWENLDALNQQIWERHRDRPLAEVLEWYRRSFEAVIAAVHAIPEQDLTARDIYPWLPSGASLAELITINSSGHAEDHRPDLEHWVASRRA